MRESGETFFKENHPALQAKQDNQKNEYLSANKSKTDSKFGPLSQMVAAGQQVQLEELKQKEIENEQLKAVIEIMKEEMM